MPQKDVPAGYGPHYPKFLLAQCNTRGHPMSLSTMLTRPNFHVLATKFNFCPFQKQKIFFLKKKLNIGSFSK